jgi:hypothetical protein
MAKDTIEQNQHRFGATRVPDSNATQLGQVGCRNGTFTQTTAYTTVGAC